MADGQKADHVEMANPDNWTAMTDDGAAIIERIRAGDFAKEPK